MSSANHKPWQKCFTNQEEQKYDGFDDRIDVSDGVRQQQNDRSCWKFWRTLVVMMACERACWAGGWRTLNRCLLVTLWSATNGSQFRKQPARLPMSGHRKPPDISANIKVWVHAYIQTIRLLRAEVKVEALGDEIGNRVDRSLKCLPSFADRLERHQSSTSPARFVPYPSAQQARSPAACPASVCQR